MDDLIRGHIYFLEGKWLKCLFRVLSNENAYGVYIELLASTDPIVKGCPSLFRRTPDSKTSTLKEVPEEELPLYVFLPHKTDGFMDYFKGERKMLEHERVRAKKKVLREDCTINIGDEGTIVHVWKPGEAYVVEFIRKNTSDVVTMYETEIEVI